jgi:hypothetical protein
MNVRKISMAVPLIQRPVATPWEPMSVTWRVTQGTSIASLTGHVLVISFEKHKTISFLDIYINISSSSVASDDTNKKCMKKCFNVSIK